MSIIDDDETLQLFIEEAKDNLNGLENDLLAIEEAGENIDYDRVNQVFRAIHSIKGGAGFFGLENIKELSHHMENLLNLMRNGELVPSSPLINVLLSAADKLSELVANPKDSNEADICKDVEAMEAILKPDATPQPQPQPQEQPQMETPAPALISINVPDGRQAFALTEETVQQAFAQRDFLYLAEFDFIPEMPNPLATLQKLRQTGVVVASRLDLENASFEGEPRIPFYLLFATVLDPEIILQLLEIPAERVWQLSGTTLGLEALPSPQIEKVVPKAEPKVAVTAPPAPKPLPKKRAGESEMIKSKQSPVTDSSLRVNVKVLDSLMTLAGELVLTRNQLVQNVSAWNKQAMESTAQRLNLITSELQEAIMSTRMQPIGNVFNKFNRIVRDMSMDLGKEIELVIEGEDVDLDKTIIEAIADPLTHLVRNAVDHGVELPSLRKERGKQTLATINLRAFHEAGHVIIEVADNGAGIDPRKIKEKALTMGLYDRAHLDQMSEKELVKLIFHPGFSLAQKITDISGRGVGMDVVHTNLTKIGGIIDIDTQMGQGTTFRIKLPLTLAIIPCLLVSVENERLAIPQVNLVELVRVPAAQVKQRIEKIGSAMVMRLRGNLLPLVSLREVLGIEDSTFEDPKTGERFPERRQEIVDRRGESASVDAENRQKGDRRYHAQSAVNIVVVTAGDFHYGIIVDNLLDSEEIVVKPLGRHFSDCKGYAGATILGDGRVALILDVVGVSNLMKLSVVNEAVKEKQSMMTWKEHIKDAQSLIIVKNAGKEQFAIPLGLISRIERIHKSDIEFTGGRMDIKYRGGNLALFSIEEVANVGVRDDVERLYVIVFPVAGREVGILVSNVIDVVDINVEIDEITFRQPGILGSAIILNETTLLVDLYGIVSARMPEWLQAHQPKIEDQKSATVLLVEDSNFFLNQIQGFIEDAGYQVIPAQDGVLALDAMESHPVDLIVTDIEMPNMDGLEMTKRIRSDARYSHLPVIAVTSIAGEAAEKKGLQAGINDYLIKLDREKILERISHYLRQSQEGR